MRTPRFYHGLELRAAPQELGLQVFKSGTQRRVNLPRRGEGGGRWHHVIATLAAIHMIVGVHPLTQAGRRQGGQHLIHIHVTAGAGAGLKHRHGERISMLTGCHGLRSIGNGARHRGRQHTDLRVGTCCGRLDQSQCVQKRGGHAAPGKNAGMIQGALGLRTKQGVLRHLHLAHAVGFETGCHNQFSFPQTA